MLLIYSQLESLSEEVWPDASDACADQKEPSCFQTWTCQHFHKIWRGSWESQVGVLLYWQNDSALIFSKASEGLLHLNDRLVLVLDSIKLCSFFLHFLAVICSCLVRYRLLPWWSGWGQTRKSHRLRRPDQRLHFLLPVQPGDAAYHRVIFDKSLRQIKSIIQ